MTCPQPVAHLCRRVNAVKGRTRDAPLMARRESGVLAKRSQNSLEEGGGPGRAGKKEREENGVKYGSEGKGMINC